MLKRFFKGLKLHAETSLTLLLSILLFFAVGLCFLCVIMMLVGEEDGWFNLGTLLATVALVCVAVANYMNYPGKFMLALCVGRTRKEFMLCHALERLLWVTLAYGLVLLLAWIERELGRKLFAEAEEVWELLPILADFRVILIAIPALVLLEMFCGTLYSRFGKPVNVVIYILWMTMAMSMSRWVHLLPRLRLPAPLWITLGLAAGAAMALTVAVLGRKQNVR